MFLIEIGIHGLHLVEASCCLSLRGAVVAEPLLGWMQSCQDKDTNNHTLAVNPGPILHANHM